MKCFPDPSALAEKQYLRLSSLNPTELKISVQVEEKNVKKVPDLPEYKVSEEPEETRLRVFFAPRPGYTTSAREGNVQGEILIAVTFGKDGFVPEIVVKRGLPEGLLRQAIFSVLRTKFLPKIDNGVPVNDVRDMSFGFLIY